jgi:hypothetical protein
MFAVRRRSPVLATEVILEARAALKVQEVHGVRRFYLVTLLLESGLQGRACVQAALKKDRGQKNGPFEGPSSAFSVFVMMATMLDNDHALCAPIAPVSIMVSFTTHFDTHTATVTISIAMHLAAVTITVVAITTDADAKLFGTSDGGSSDRNSR